LANDAELAVTWQPARRQLYLAPSMVP
jgi:hypothetical protein